MNFEELKEDCANGLSTYLIAEKRGRSQTNVRKWLDFYGLKTNPIITRNFSRKRNKTLEEKQKLLMDNLLKYDWQAIQSLHNQGAGWRETSRTFNISQTYLAHAQKLNLFVSKNKAEAQKRGPSNFRHSEESKKKISAARKKYLAENNMPAWKIHNKFKSQPCEWLKTELKNRGFKLEEEYQPLLHKKRFFSMDIAFLGVKFAIEINGRQHYDANGNLNPYYQERHDLISAEGWDIWEVKYHETRSPLFLERVLNKLKEKMVVVEGLTPPVKAINLAPL